MSVCNVSTSFSTVFLIFTPQQQQQVRCRKFCSHMLWLLLQKWFSRFIRLSMLVSQHDRQCEDALSLTEDTEKRSCCTWTEEERRWLVPWFDGRLVCLCLVGLWRLSLKPFSYSLCCYMSIIQPIKYIFWSCFVVSLFFTSYIISCSAHAPEGPAGGSHAPHEACGGACCAKRGQALWWGGLGSVHWELALLQLTFKDSSA